MLHFRTPRPLSIVLVTVFWPTDRETCGVDISEFEKEQRYGHWRDILDESIDVDIDNEI